MPCAPRCRLCDVEGLDRVGVVDDGPGGAGPRRRLRGHQRRPHLLTKAGAGTRSRWHPRQLRMPAGVDTPLMRSWAARCRSGGGAEGAGRDASLTNRSPKPRRSPQAILFLASPAASFITGYALPVEGGAIANIGADRLWPATDGKATDKYRANQPPTTQSKPATDNTDNTDQLNVVGVAGGRDDL